MGLPANTVDRLVLVPIGTIHESIDNSIELPNFTHIYNLNPISPDEELEDEEMVRSEYLQSHS